MKSRYCLPAFLLMVTLCELGVPCDNTWSATSSTSAAASGQMQSSDKAATSSPEVTDIPGPLRSFLRMAAISQQVSPEQVLPLLARNIVVNGYQDGKPTQFLILVNGYLNQARELEALAGPQGIIHVSNCEDAKPLLRILGYRLRQPCGPGAAVETEDPNRAFLTIDSGFPLADLEETLRRGRPFDDPFTSTKLPVLFHAKDWLGNERDAKRGVVDSLVRNPEMARLYWGLARMDSETAAYLWKSLGPKKLIASAAVLDFYGSHISIRSGRVLVPGGTESESVWKDLVGASPTSPPEFVSWLLTKDEGWMAAYFDALSRVGRVQQAYFADPRHLQNFYMALRGKSISPSPTKHSFRPDEGLFLLVARLQLDPNGQPHVPGDLDVWKAVFRAKTDSKVIHDWARRARDWKSPEQLMEGMFAVSRVASNQDPLDNFLMLSEIDRERAPARRLNAETAHLLAEKFPRFGDQYKMFAEFHALNDLSITRYLTIGEYLSAIPDRLVRADALGLFQANLGLWQILARQGEIPDASLNDSWQRAVNAFGGVRSSVQVFDAGKTALEALLTAATGKPVLSQDQILSLLAGPEQSSKEGQQLRADMATRMRRVLDDQRLVSLDTLLALGDGFSRMARGSAAPESLLPLAAELREFEMPKPLFTNGERAELVSGLYGNRHITLQMRTDLSKVIKRPGSPAELTDARGLLTPFLRDTLVGLNYAYYEPPGAQMLHNNPLFVRSHDFSGGDFSGEITTAGEQTWRTPHLFGRGWTAGGGAHLVGSLADLPYVLAEVEQDFIVPQNVQSLIWEDFVPALMTSAVLPRWWGVTRNELHAVTLYQRTGEELLASAAKDEKLRPKVLDILSDRMLPQRSEQIDLALRSGSPGEALAQVAPAETFYLAAEFRRRYPAEKGSWGAAGKELENLVASHPAETSWDRLSEDFGVPHPALQQNYARELLNVKPFPTFLDYSSRLLAESWDSNNLYWARLADEMGYSPVMLNELVPELTRRMVEQTFASNLEDWPAVLRAMRETGEEFRQGKIAAVPKSGSAAGI
jgi:hypothetical protein